MEKYKSRRFGRYADESTDVNEEDKPRQRKGTGLSGYGLDALQLSLDALQNPVAPLPCSAVSRPQRRGKYRSSGPAISADDGTLEELAPMCAQHGMKCKLLIVKKSGGNKVLFFCCLIHSCNVFRVAGSMPVPIPLINAVISFYGQK